MFKLFLRHCRARAGAIGCFFACGVLLSVSFFLFRLPWQAVCYAGILCFAVAALVLVLDFLHQLHRHRHLQRAKQGLPLPLRQLPPPEGPVQQDLTDMLAILQSRLEALQSEKIQSAQDMADYYTTWVHQIKTPIAAMQLALADQDSELARQLSRQLVQIEQYVQMALAYQRLESDQTDYLFCSHALDEMVRNSVRRFASQFIARQLKLEYTPLPGSIVTDEKWFCFVLEQLLSNALKYTPAGSISVTLQQNCLCIRDTGIGIAPEDLPRIFEKGYTGINGRQNIGDARQKASGLGLYLCKRVCDNLGIVLTAESVVGEGSVFRLNLTQADIRAE